MRTTLESINQRSLGAEEWVQVCTGHESINPNSLEAKDKLKINRSRGSVQHGLKTVLRKMQHVTHRNKEGSERENRYKYTTALRFEFPTVRAVLGCICVVHKLLETVIGPEGLVLSVSTPRLIYLRLEPSLRTCSWKMHRVSNDLQVLIILIFGQSLTSPKVISSCTSVMDPWDKVSPYQWLDLCVCDSCGKKQYDCNLEKWGTVISGHDLESLPAVFEQQDCHLLHMKHKAIIRVQNLEAHAATFYQHECQLDKMMHNDPQKNSAAMARTHETAFVKCFWCVWEESQLGRIMSCAQRWSMQRQQIENQSKRWIAEQATWFTRVWDNWFFGIRARSARQWSLARQTGRFCSAWCPDPAWCLSKRSYSAWCPASDDIFPQDHTLLDAQRRAISGTW